LLNKKIDIANRADPVVLWFFVVRGRPLEENQYSRIIRVEVKAGTRTMGSEVDGNSTQDVFRVPVDHASRQRRVSAVSDWKKEKEKAHTDVTMNKKKHYET